MTAYQRIRKRATNSRVTGLPPVQRGEPIVIQAGVPEAGTRLERLFRKDPNCHWCARETLLTRSFGGGWLPKDAATIDHIYSRINPAHKGKRHLYVLACYSCNQQRCRDEGIILFAKKLTGRERVLRLIAQSMAQLAE